MIRLLLVRGTGALHLLAPIALLAAILPAQELAWAELARRPELWPKECRMTQEVRFQRGASLKPGEVVDVLELRAGDVVVATRGDSFQFAAGKDQTDVLEVAQAAFAAMTPAQRELTYQALETRSELWPYHVALTESLQMGDGTVMEKGSEYVFLRYEGHDLVLFDQAHDTRTVVEAAMTDLMERARQAVAAEAPGPGRILREVDGKLIALQTGEAATIDPEHKPRYYAFYYSAGWCGPCRKFSPKLVEFYNAQKPTHDEFEVVFVSSDKSADALATYAKDEAFPWLAVPFDRLGDVPILDGYRGGGIPQLLVVDEHGKVLADSYRNGQYIGPDRALAQLAGLLKKTER